MPISIIDRGGRSDGDIAGIGSAYSKGRITAQQCNTEIIMYTGYIRINQPFTIPPLVSVTGNLGCPCPKRNRKIILDQPLEV